MRASTYICISMWCVDAGVDPRVYSIPYDNATLKLASSNSHFYVVKLLLAGIATRLPRVCVCVCVFVYAYVSLCVCA